MMLMIGDSWRTHRTGVQPLHRASGDTGSEEDQGKGQDPAATDEREHAQKIGLSEEERKNHPHPERGEGPVTLAPELCNKALS
jgi:hypothetical protein